MDVEKVNSAYVYDSMLALADKLEPLFPHHSKCIRDECVKWTLMDGGEYKSSPQKMTDRRWNRLADIIGSLAALPGTLLDEETKHLRLRALCLAEAPRAMARVQFGGKRSYGASELAVHIALSYETPKDA